MGDFTTRNSIRKPLKDIGQIQQKYMFSCDIPYIPMLGPTPDFKILVRSTSIPEIKRDKTVLNTVLQTEITFPNRIELTHEWPVTLIMPEMNNDLFRKLYIWNLLIDKFPINIMKTGVKISLLNINNEETEFFILSGIYPLNFPSVNDLSYDTVNEYVTADFIFAFDDIIMGDVAIPGV